MTAFWFKILLVPIVMTFGVFIGLLYKGIDRILVARMQSRVGPPISQPYRDFKKLMVKDNIVPRNAVKWLFNLMPVVALSTTLLILLYLPLGGAMPLLEGHGDLILVLYLLIFPALALVLGGFSSGSPYAIIGAQREMIVLMSYEFPLAIISISVAWLVSSVNIGLNSFSFSVISNNIIWSLVGPIGFIGLILLFLVLLFVMQGELGRAPFDVSKADTEIAGGVLSEYSGRNLALFYLANITKMVAVGSLIIALFLPWNVSNFLNLTGVLAYTSNLLFFLIKLFLVIFIGSTLIKVASARLKINQVVSAYWFRAMLVSLFGLTLIWIDVVLQTL